MFCSHYLLLFAFFHRFITLNCLYLFRFLLFSEVIKQRKSNGVIEDGKRSDRETKSCCACYVILTSVTEHKYSWTNNEKTKEQVLSLILLVLRVSCVCRACSLRVPCVSRDADSGKRTQVLQDKKVRLYTCVLYLTIHHYVYFSCVFS